VVQSEVLSTTFSRQLDIAVYTYILAILTCLKIILHLL